jgi:hypothetical protein
LFQICSLANCTGERDGEMTALRQSDVGRMELFRVPVNGENNLTFIKLERRQDGSHLLHFGDGFRAAGALR